MLWPGSPWLTMFASLVAHSTGVPVLDAREDFARARSTARMQTVALAARRGISLPPMAVLHGSDGYDIEDGRHRVSVARAAGGHEIDARVR
jgi:hypothetical protein